MKFLSNKRIYLDYAGATQIDHNIAQKMAFCEKAFSSNPSAIYKSGVKARSVIEEGREKIAKLINAHSDEIVFTGSGTESDALAIIGIIKNYELKIKNEKLEYKIPHIITSQIEHPAVIENCKDLEKNGYVEVTYISVDKNGIINLEELKDALKENTILVSIMYANNEIGTVEPIQDIAKIIRHFKKGKDSIYPIFHTDASQAMNYLFTENIEKLGVDMMSFNGGKIYGPKGIGVLYKKRNIDLIPLYVGGGQEFGLRSGTENISLIFGVALALEKSFKMKEKESARLIKLRDYGIEKLLALSGTSGYKIVLNGDKEKRLPNNINISISGISSELLVIELDANGIEVSEKSACHSKSDNSSYVIKAIRKICKRGSGEEGSLRISLGRQTTKKDIDFLIKKLSFILKKYYNYII